MIAKLVLILAVAVCSINADRVKFKDCGSNTGELLYVEVDGCDANAERCNLYKGQDAVMRLGFKSKVDTSSLTSKVAGVIFGVPVPFPLPDSNACNAGAKCPVANGEQNEIEIKLPIMSIYPSLSLNVKWQINDNNNKVHVCFTIPVKIASN